MIKITEKIDRQAPHPEAATAWDTEVLIIRGEELKSLPCQVDFEDKIGTPVSEDDLVDSANTVAFNLLEFNALHVSYHWCFYSRVAKLDSYLIEDNHTLDEKVARVMKTMMFLWPLAKGLDHYLMKMRYKYPPHMYFDYLRIRYVQIMHDYFGRDVEVMSLPLRGREIFLTPEQILERKSTDEDVKAVLKADMAAEEEAIAKELDASLEDDLEDIEDLDLEEQGDQGDNTEQGSDDSEEIDGSDGSG